MLKKPFNSCRTGGRAANRLGLGVRAGLVLTHATRRCIIVNLSASGARLELDDPPARGEMAVLQFHRLKLYGNVMWRRMGFCGFRFDRALLPEDMKSFLWIAQNPEEYARYCKQSGGLEWSMGLGD